jgi:membrane associated rhomboid family serine protease
MVMPLVLAAWARATSSAGVHRRATSSAGARGAIAGVLGGYLVLYPTSRIGTLVGLGFLYFPARIYAWAFIVFWFLLQLVNGVAGIRTDAAAGSGVAYWAHVGGFLTGVVLVRLFAHPGRVQQMEGLQAQPA